MLQAVRLVALVALTFMASCRTTEPEMTCEDANQLHPEVEHCASPSPTTPHIER